MLDEAMKEKKKGEVEDKESVDEATSDNIQDTKDNKQSETPQSEQVQAEGVHDETLEPTSKPTGPVDRSRISVEPKTKESSQSVDGLGPPSNEEPTKSLSESS